MLSHAGACSREIKIERIPWAATIAIVVSMHTPREVAARSVGAKGFSLPQVVLWCIREKLRSGWLVNGETVEIAFVFDGDFDHAGTYPVGRFCKGELASSGRDAHTL